MYSLVKNIVLILVVIAAIAVSARIGYNCGLERAPKVHCAVQVEHELLSNKAFRSYVSRQYGRAFQKEIDEFLMSPTMESIVLEWLRTEAPLCRNPIVKVERPASKPMTAEDFTKFFTRPRNPVPVR